jgi:glycosyltransferase involved in cell wall biosynthesis
VIGQPAVLLINSLGTGGAERAVMAVAAELGRRGRSVRIVCLEASPAADTMPALHLSRASSTTGGVLKLVVLPILAVRLSRYVDRENVALVMSHLFRANFVNVLSRLLARSRHRAILVNHTRLSRVFSEGIPGRINWMLCRWLYPRADLVASVSSGAAAETARLLRLPEGRSITLHDPVHTAPTRTSPSQSVVCVGRLVPLKRFQDVIIAFARVAPEHPELQLRIVGDGPERQALERLSGRLEVAARVTFCGAVADPAGLVAGCLCFVSSSETEGFGMAIVEALAAGVPVIASDCAYGPREILNPASDPSRLLEPGADIEVAPLGILYPVGSVQALEKALRTLLSDVSLRAELARRGPGRAADFSIERAASEYGQLLFPA